MESVSSPPPSAWERNTKLIKAKCIKHHLPLGLLLALLLAMAWDTPGIEVSKPTVGDFRVVQTINVCVVFLISGVTLNTAELKNAVTSGVPALLYGMVAILIITACFSYIALELPLEPREFRFGVALFCCVPTTLSSGVVLVRAAKGNESMALLLTVATNLLGTLVTPFTLGLVLSAANVDLDTVALLTKLLVTVLAPLLAGKALLEAWAPVKGWVKANKQKLTMTSSLMIILVVWQSFSRSMDSLMEQNAGHVFALILVVVVLHFAFLTVNFVATKALRLDWPESKTIMLMCSQKTLPVAMSVLAYLPEKDVGAAGLVAIPCIVGHISQLFIDAFIAAKWVNSLGARG